MDRDLKSSNIFLTKAGAKIGDVGLAKLLTSSDFSSSLLPVGTFVYCAPELLLGDRYSEKVGGCRCFLTPSKALSTGRGG